MLAKNGQNRMKYRRSLKHAEHSKHKRTSGIKYETKRNYEKFMNIQTDKQRSAFFARRS